MVCVMAGMLVLNGVVGVECLVYNERRQGALYQALVHNAAAAGQMGGVM
jgi:hypothetical protein